MTITLIHCDVKLKVVGIDIQAIGSYDQLRIAMSQRLSFIGLEYDFLQDSIKVDVEEGIDIPDLSDFGEVIPYDSPIG